MELRGVITLLITFRIILAPNFMPRFQIIQNLVIAKSALDLVNALSQHLNVFWTLWWNLYLEPILHKTLV